MVEMENHFNLNLSQPLVVLENHFDLNLSKPLVVLGLVLIPLGIIGQVLAIFYEMFGMDSMKRGIVNRVR